MWKKLLLAIGSALLIAIIGYQISFLRTLHQIRQQDTDPDQRLVSESDTVPTGDGSDKVTRATDIVIESYDADGKLIERSQEKAGADLIGNNRLDMLLYANSYREQATAQEKQDGFERMVLESFSPQTVTLVKYYGEPRVEQGYFIGLKDNAVIVYLEDRSEVYEYTNIEAWSLPLDVRSDLVEGIYVENEQELFDFLQTYSS